MPWDVEKGSFPYISWKDITPSDQMSTFLSYGFSYMISGAIVIGVPQYVSIKSFLFYSLANPKSASLIW